ncbi:MAG: prepilin peptidase [Roseibacillus sp.]
MEVILGYPMWLGCVFVVGACIGSYLNVVIYRWPIEDLSVSTPQRSFCPICKKEIPWYRNLPIATWILQRAKCAECGAPISFRYVFVEIFTALLFTAGWYVYVTKHTPIAPVAAALVAILAVLLISIAFIDADHMLVPVDFCWWGMGIGVIGSLIDPTLLTLEGARPEMTWWKGGLEALFGIAAGWGGLVVVVYLGKQLMGQKKLSFKEAHDWYLHEPESDEDQLCFVLKVPKKGTEGEELEFEEEPYAWGDLFFRDSDRLEIEGHGILLDGERTKATSLVISREAVQIGEEQHSIEKIKSLSGKADKVVIPREAMGDGDPPLLGLIGAFIGWHGVIFALFAGCIFAIMWAIPARIGFGKHLPFGPFLAVGGVVWIFGGWMLWEWYFESLAGFAPVPPPMPTQP